MLNQLDTANMSDLPMIMRFLLQTATAEKIEDIILKIRQKLDFKALAKVLAAEKDVVSFRPANAPVDKGMVPEALVLGKKTLHYSQYHCS
jgi:Fanconi anemia group D2 protein